MKKENEKLIEENSTLNLVTSSLNSRISNLEKNISSFKVKYEDILKNVSKFNKGKKIEFIRKYIHKYVSGEVGYYTFKGIRP